MAENQDAGEKTEEATPKKREEAREKGQVAMSNEIVVAGGLLASVLAAYWIGPILFGAGQGVVADGMRGLSAGAAAEGDVTYFAQAMRTTGLRFIPAFLALTLPMYFLSLVIGYGQIGFRFSPKAIAMDLNKLNPIKGAQKIIGPRGWVKTGLAVLKITLISTAVVGMVYLQRERLTALVSLDLTTVLTRIAGILVRAALAGIAMAILIGVLDLVYQRMQHGKDLRMTKKDLKDEAKNMDGDPQVKARIRNLQREVARGRMMEDVPDASVIITNPTHFAVALRYDENDSNRAPYVVAKGIDQVAQNIKRIAREAGVPIIEDKPLARGLHRMVDIGDDIPEELFEAVAKILAFVLRPGESRNLVGGPSA